MAAVKKTSRRSTLSAGILAYRKGGARGLEVLLVHPGGPFWREKDESRAGKGLSRRGQRRAPDGSTHSCSPKEFLP